MSTEAPPRHVYIHVPFCRAKCDYSDFYSEPLGEKRDGAGAAHGDAADAAQNAVARVGEVEEIMVQDPLDAVPRAPHGGHPV